jgi:phosphatidylserine/phosphatidylglycerophosphate/cardiolipin synthase-like enzyme
VRYFTRRFHAKIYVFDEAALVGSSNLTDGGLKADREATMCLDQPDDLDAIEEIRALFVELWESAHVLT